MIKNKPNTNVNMKYISMTHIDQLINQTELKN